MSARLSRSVRRAHDTTGLKAMLNASSSAVTEDRRMCFRAGVHLGDVIEKSDATICGDRVPTQAARNEHL